MNPVPAESPSPELDSRGYLLHYGDWSEALAVAFAAAEVERERQEIEAPHFDVLPAGARIGEPRNVPEVLVDANFELAAVGARIGPESALQAAPVIPATEFELAAPGARMQPEQTGQNIPRPPDVTHLSVIENTRPLSPQ